MTYQNFLDNIHTNISNSLGPSYSVTIRDIIKNNDTHLDGLTIQSAQCNLSPTIYLNNYYRQYCDGTPLVDICHNILDLYQAHRPSDSIDITFFTDYEKVSKRIVYKLINREQNCAMLSDVPHFEFLDLAIVFQYMVDADLEGTATILIHNNHLEMWGITADDLYVLADENTPKLLNYDLRSMTDVLKEMLDESDHYGITDDPSQSLCSMYVLSNRHKLNGSSCMLYPGLLKRFADKLQSDLFILPSSVHEVIILPATDGHSHEELDEMVREVNRTQLSREDVLSDHAYVFSRELGEIIL